MKHDTTSAQCHEYMLSRTYEMTSLREAVSRCQKNSKAVGTSQIMQLNMSLTSRLFQKQTILQNRSPRYSKILPKRYPNLVVPQKPFRDEFGRFLGFQTFSRGFQRRIVSSSTSSEVSNYWRVWKKVCKIFWITAFH